MGEIVAEVMAEVTVVVAAEVTVVVVAEAEQKKCLNANGYLMLQVFCHPDLTNLGPKYVTESKLVLCQGIFEGLFSKSYRALQES